MIHHRIIVYKIFSKRFRFQLHYQNQQQLFTDRTGKSLKIEPIATVGQLQTFLASMVKNFILFMFQNNSMIIHIIILNLLNV
jgi:hypothetical protein